MIAVRFVSVVDQPERFGSAHQVMSYVGLTPASRRSQLHSPTCCNRKSLPAFERRLKRYTQPAVLILELGYLPCDGRATDILFNIISRRHEQRSTVISTNLAFKQWGTVFPGAACVVALVDRFAQHCHKIDIDADPWRDRRGFERDDSPGTTTNPPRRPSKKR